MTIDITIRQMMADDIDRIAHAFTKLGKERAQYKRYFNEQERGDRLVLVALYREEIVGYATVVWYSGYEPFLQEGTPEIVDLNVITEHQRRGIGTALIHTAEHIAVQHSMTIIGISVEQSPIYAKANRLYLKLGYIPDGRGITQHDNELHLIKKL